MNCSAACRARIWSAGMHGGHVEVERQEASILVVLVVDGFGCNFFAGEALVYLQIFFTAF